MKILSFKDTQFILEALNNLFDNYSKRLEKLEEIDGNEDEIADLSNDCLFLEELIMDINQILAQGNTPSLPSNYEHLKK